MRRSRANICCDRGAVNRAGWDRVGMAAADGSGWLLCGFVSVFFMRLFFIRFFFVMLQVG